MKNITIISFLFIFLFSGSSAASDKFIEAIKSGDINTVKSMISAGEDINQKYGTFNSPAIFATQGFSENFEMMKFLVESGADINAMDKDDSSLLMASISFGSLQYIEYLLKKGLDPNQIDKDQSYPLALACSRGDLEKTKLLVSYGADVNKVTGGLTFGYSPLISAVVRGKKDVVQFLLDSGADKNYRSSDGTALELATAMGKQELVELLGK